MRNDAQLLRADERFHLRQVSAQVRVVMLVDEPADLRRPDPRPQNFQHDRTEIVPVAAVDQHGLVAFPDQIRVCSAIRRRCPDIQARRFRPLFRLDRDPGCPRCAAYRSLPNHSFHLLLQHCYAENCMLPLFYKGCTKGATFLFDLFQWSSRSLSSSVSVQLGSLARSVSAAGYSVRSPFVARSRISRSRGSSKFIRAARSGSESSALRISARSRMERTLRRISAI